MDTPNGEHWFVHFQDKGPFGRVVHLQPMHWENGWPVIGENGEPVLRHRKPWSAAPVARETPSDSDEFNEARIGPQWQWEANPQPGWAFPSQALGVLRLFCLKPPADFKNLYDLPNLLLQKFPAPEFIATAKLNFTPMADGDKAGLLIFGSDYAYLAIQRRGEKLEVSLSKCEKADQGSAEVAVQAAAAPSAEVYLRVHVSAGGEYKFSYSFDGADYAAIGGALQPGRGRGSGQRQAFSRFRAPPALRVATRTSTGSGSTESRPDSGDAALPEVFGHDLWRARRARNQSALEQDFHIPARPSRRCIRESLAQVGGVCDELSCCTRTAVGYAGDYDRWTFHRRGEHPGHDGKFVGRILALFNHAGDHLVGSPIEHGISPILAMHLEVVGKLARYIQRPLVVVEADQHHRMVARFPVRRSFFAHHPEGLASRAQELSNRDRRNKVAIGKVAVTDLFMSERLSEVACRTASDGGALGLPSIF